MAQSLGEKLREAREARGITISEVSEQTRISAHYLDSIENNDYRTLPGGIFNKGFVKSYAKYVGIDEQEALADYSRLIAEQEDLHGGEPKIYQPEVLTDDRTASSMLPTLIFAVIILGLMTWGILALVGYMSETGQPAESGEPVANANTDTANKESAEQVLPSNTSVQPAPAMNALKVEFRTIKDAISLASTMDGEKANTLVSPEKPVGFEPKESLKLGFARSLAPSARLLINGKEIKLPSEPENPKRIAIEFEINKDNLDQIWQRGEITFDNPAPAASPAGDAR